MLVLRKNREWNTLPTMDSFLNEFFGNQNLSLGNKYNDTKVNISEDENSYGISLALPGYKKDDVNIQLKDGYLVISSEFEKTNEEKNENYVKKEFMKSSFEKSFPLPEDVNDENIEASMEDGVLSITLNKIKEIENTTNVKKIDIK
jgi:HSP20 family protein